MEYQREEHSVHLILYYLVWTTKRRKSVLKDEIAHDCRRLIDQACAERGWEIVNLVIQPDHVHLLVSVWPSTSAADVVKAVKRRTSGELRARYAVLHKIPSLWNRSYYAATTGKVSSEAIRRYIASQHGL